MLPAEMCGHKVAKWIREAAKLDPEVDTNHVWRHIWKTRAGRPDLSRDVEKDDTAMSVGTVIISALLTFICTGVLANWLVQRWQYRNWINQQRFLGSEKKYESLKSHADEIAKISASRLSSMFRLILSLDQSDERVEERRKIYSDNVDTWNQNINSFSYKTTMYFNWDMSKRLEDEIHNEFVAAGAKIERAVRARLANEANYAKDKTQILDRLNAIQGRLVHYNRDMLRYVLRQQSATYHGVEIGYNVSDLQYLTTWQLFKALFITRVEEFSVTLTAFELERPSRS